MLRAMQVIIRKADKKTLENQIQDTEFYMCVNFKNTVKNLSFEGWF